MMTIINNAILILYTIIGIVSAASKPKVSISIRDGIYDGLEGLDPTLTWSDSTESGAFDISYGIEAALRPTSDISTLPKSIWGKVSTEVSGWDVSAKASFDGKDFTNADVELDAYNEDNDLTVHVEATVGPDIVVNSVQATKEFIQDDATITITPRYDLITEEKDIIATYSKDKTNVKVIASQENQEITISQQVDELNRIAPTFNNNGDISITWERTIDDDSTVTATLKPNDNLNIEWKDGDWTANVNMPIDGANVKGANVSIKRDVQF